jgi:hypothetical protein
VEEVLVCKIGGAGEEGERVIEGPKQDPDGEVGLSSLRGEREQGCCGVELKKEALTDWPLSEMGCAFCSQLAELGRSPSSAGRESSVEDELRPAEECESEDGPE